MLSTCGAAPRTAAAAPTLPSSDSPSSFLPASMAVGPASPSVASPCFASPVATPIATAAAGVGLYQLAPSAAKARDSELDEEGQPLVASPVLHLQAPHLGRTPRRQQPLLPV